MSTPQEVKLALELALHLASAVNMFEPEAKELLEITEKIRQALSPVSKPKANPKPEDHPVDALLKKGKVELPDGRYKQLVQIYDLLMLTMSSIPCPPDGLKFLSAKQNQHVTWFPLSLNGDKSAALFLGNEWNIEPIGVKANGELSGEWEDFDLNQAMEDSDFDQDEY